MAVISSIQIDTKSASKSIADLEKELQETNEQLKQVDINSDAFTDLQKKAADAKGQLDKINQTTDALSKGFQGFGENLAKVTGGISGGITAATAAMQLMGIENENVMEGIAKLQQLMAFTQGISALKDLGAGFTALIPAIKAVTVSLKGVKGAIVATGVGLFAIALGEIVAHWDDITTAVQKFVDKTDIVETSINTIKGAFEAMKQTITTIGTAIKNYIMTPIDMVMAFAKTYEETEGKWYEKIVAGGKAAINAIQENINEVVAEGEKIGDAYENGKEKSAKERKAKRDAEAKKEAAQRLKEAAELSEKEIAIKEEQLKRQNLSDKQRYEEELKLAEEHLKNMEILHGKNSLEYEKALTNVDTALKNLKGELEATSLSTPIEGITVAAADANAALQNLQTTYNQTGESALNFQQQVNATKEALDDEFGVISDTFSRLTESSYGISSEWQSAFGEIMQATDTFLEALSKGTDSAAEDWVKVAAAGAQAIGSVLNTLADQQDATTKEGFEKQKKYQYAATVMNAAGGVMNAWVSAMNPANAWMTIWGQIAMGASTTAAILALMGVQLAKIKSTPFEGGGGSSASASMSAAATSITTPEQYSTAVEGADIETAVADSKVYVVESDIQAVGNKVSVQETENRY